jgi:hypothetical protein
VRVRCPRHEGAAACEERARRKRESRCDGARTRARGSHRGTRERRGGLLDLFRACDEARGWRRAQARAGRILGDVLVRFVHDGVDGTRARAKPAVRLGGRIELDDSVVVCERLPSGPFVGESGERVQSVDGRLASTSHQDVWAISSNGRGCVCDHGRQFAHGRHFAHGREATRGAAACALGPRAMTQLSSKTTMHTRTSTIVGS